MYQANRLIPNFTILIAIFGKKLVEYLDYSLNKIYVSACY